MYFVNSEERILLFLVWKIYAARLWNWQNPLTSALGPQRIDVIVRAANSTNSNIIHTLSLNASFEM